MLDKKTFIVTGGAKGIGGSISRLIASEGGRVIIADRDEENNNLIVQDISENGGKAFAITVDLTDYDASKRIIDFAMVHASHIHGLVNNAGVNDKVGLESGSLEQFEKSLRINLFHYYSVTQYALPYLKKTRGSIVNISSKTAVTGQGGTSGYVAAKGAINALTREWAVELIYYGIRVNCVIPAEVLTPLYKLNNSETKMKEIELNIPLGRRLTDPEEIANAVLFLLSEKSSHTTGQLMYVDGGYTHLDRIL